MTRRLVHIGVALVVAIALVACGDDDGGDTSSGTGPSATATTGQVTSTTGEDATSTTVTTTTTAPSTTTTAPPVTASPVPAACGDVQSWGAGPRDLAAMAPDELYLVRVGRHDCYDRVVFDINGVVPGPEVAGYHVSYVSGDVRADGSGQPVPTAGDAALQVVVRAWIYGAVSGHQPGRQPPGVGDDFFSAQHLRDWASLKQVTFAGSFEGQTTIAVGVPARRPFRVGSFERDGYTHVYVDIAHGR
jgi:hypothetical protein